MPVRHEFANAEDFKKALLDWFAGQALIGIASQTEWQLEAVKHHLSEKVPRIAAESAYAIADAMLKAREQP